jgi:hypothetical protein
MTLSPILRGLQYGAERTNTTKKAPSKQISCLIWCMTFKLKGTESPTNSTFIVRDAPKKCFPEDKAANPSRQRDAEVGR